MIRRIRIIRGLFLLPHLTSSRIAQAQRTLAKISAASQKKSGANFFEPLQLSFE
jgi:hypothetical protein